MIMVLERNIFTFSSSFGEVDLLCVWMTKVGMWLELCHTERQNVLSKGYLLYTQKCPPILIGSKKMSKHKKNYANLKIKWYFDISIVNHVSMHLLHSYLLPPFTDISDRKIIKVFITRHSSHIFMEQMIRDFNSFNYRRCQSTK